VEWELWAYGTGQELEKSIDAVLKVPSVWEKREVGINKVSHTEHEPWRCCSVCPGL